MKNFKRFCAQSVHVAVRKTRQLVAKAAARRGKVLFFCEELDEPFSCNTTIELVQAQETANDRDVREYLRSCQLKPGQAVHVLSLLITQPEIVRLIVPAGKQVVDDENTIGGPIVALDSPDKKWCAVLCADPKGPIFCDGFIKGDGWKPGTFFVAVPDGNYWTRPSPNEAFRSIHPYPPPILVH